jgi:hypothetical protein
VSINRRMLLKAGGSFLALGIGACATQPGLGPFVLKPTVAPDPVHCFTTVGHMPGATPFILGGTCFCTPTEALMDAYHAAGHLLDMHLDDLLREYNDRGIKLQIREHQNCNNLCQWGPHLLKGGKCMASPTPGTRNFEEIRYGRTYMRKPAA